MQMLTQEEKNKLDQQLKDMIAQRPQIAKRIEEAREKGDLKENADYHAAREELALLEARIKDLEGRLRSVSVIDTNEIPEGIVFLGSTVKVKDTKTGDEDVFRIVGELSNNESDDFLEISATSPLGEALMRAHVGNVVRVRVPRGEIEYKIIELL